MGQLVSVRQSPSSTPGLRRYELNRSLTGMGHERYTSVRDIAGLTPGSRLAERLLSTGQVASVHVYQNIVTVDLEAGFGDEGLEDIIAEMYLYWRPGVEPPEFEDVVPEESGSDDAAAGGDPALAEAAKKVPMHLLERAKAARERWNANH